MSNYLRVTAPSGLRIRSGPGTNCDEFDAVPFGTVLETSGRRPATGGPRYCWKTARLGGLVPNTSRTPTAGARPNQRPASPPAFLSCKAR